MTLAVFATTSACVVLVVWAWALGRRSSYARGKADAFQQVADDFHGMSQGIWVKDKERMKATQRKGYLRLALCSPDVCDALYEALVEARAYWKHPERRRIGT